MVFINLRYLYSISSLRAKTTFIEKNKDLYENGNMMIFFTKFFSHFLLNNKFL